MMSLLSYSQRILEESDFPIKIVYQNSERVLITLDQVDSLNLAFANLEECDEYQDSLEVTIARYKSIIKEGKEVEQSLRGLVSSKDRIIEESNSLSKVLEDDNIKKAKRLKLFKRTTEILGGVATVLLIILLL